jgi:hypothetical protein
VVGADHVGGLGFLATGAGGTKFLSALFGILRRRRRHRMQAGELIGHLVEAAADAGAST